MEYEVFGSCGAVDKHYERIRSLRRCSCAGNKEQHAVAAFPPLSLASGPVLTGILSQGSAAPRQNFPAVTS